MRTAWMLALITAAGVAATAEADTVRLLAEAGVDRATVRLSDVTELDGELALAMGEVVVGAFGEGASELRVTIDAVREALDQEHANWGRMSLVGFAACRVHRSGLGEQATTVPSPVDIAAVAAANVGKPIDLDQPMTLGASIADAVAQRLGVPRSELRIDVPERHRDLLRQSLLDGRFEIQPVTSARLGVVLLAVHELDDAGRMTRRHPLRLTVSQRVMALVTSRPIERDEPFTQDNVLLKELWIDREGDLPLSARESLVGLSAAGPLAEGTPIFPAAVAQPLLVRRGDIVQVRAMVGSLMITRLGRATKDGVMDETIVLQSVGSRDTFTATVTGFRQAMVGRAVSTAAPAPHVTGSATSASHGDALTQAVDRLEAQRR